MIGEVESIVGMEKREEEEKEEERKEGSKYRETRMNCK